MWIFDAAAADDTAARCGGGGGGGGEDPPFSVAVAALYGGWETYSVSKSSLDK